MIYGIGTDLINSERVERLLNKFGNKFLFKIFSNEEIKNSKTSYNKALYFSKRFAGKEAVWKASAVHAVKCGQSVLPFLRYRHAIHTENLIPGASGVVRAHFKTCCENDAVHRIFLSIKDDATCRDLIDTTAIGVH